MAQPDEDFGMCLVDQDAGAPPAEAADSCSRCPDGSPSCFRDRDCDKVCGGRVTGSCVRINSCYKCCFCTV